MWVDELGNYGSHSGEKECCLTAARGSQRCPREDLIQSSGDQVLVFTRKRIQEGDRCKKAQKVY